LEGKGCATQGRKKRTGTTRVPRRDEKGSHSRRVEHRGNLEESEQQKIKGGIADSNGKKESNYTLEVLEQKKYKTGEKRGLETS